MTGLRIDVVGLDRLARALDPRLVTEETEETVREAALFAEGRVRERSFATHDTSATSRSWTADVNGMSASVYSPLLSALIEEEGRRPGAKMPPPGALAGWARRHGFPDNAGALFTLARAIARRDASRGSRIAPSEFGVKGLAPLRFQPGADGGAQHAVVHVGRDTEDV